MKTVNVFKYFPVKDDDTIQRFMAKDDEFDERMEQLYSILLPTVHEKESRFGTAVLSAVFQINYIVTHRWPTIK